DAAYPDDGQSLVDHAPFVAMARHAGKVVDGIELVLFPGTDPLGFYGVTDPHTIEWMKTRLTPHPWKWFKQKLHLANEAAMRALPESHIICTSTIPGRDIDRLMACSQGRVWDIDTGHDLMLTEPEWVTDRLLDVAATMD
ncbi:MAG TPA: alpha/beta hydrolase, partial [Novosphingobium sp.]|nr:alpha/beta hydrolase [Novosphingobium sp.]